MTKFNITFDERIPEILSVIKGAKNNPYSSGELAEMFTAYVVNHHGFNENTTVEDVHDSNLSSTIADDFGDFLFETFGVSNFVEVYPRDYGYHYAENSVYYLFDLLD